MKVSKTESTSTPQRGSWSFFGHYHLEKKSKEEMPLSKLVKYIRSSHKPSEQLRGIEGGLAKYHFTTLLYLVKMSTKGEGVKNHKNMST